MNRIFDTEMEPTKPTPIKISIAASELGRRSKGKHKTLSMEQRAILADRMRAAQAKRAQMQREAAAK